MKIGGIAGVRQLTPRNDGMVNRAQDRLNHITARANKQLMNALNVDGFDALIWHKTRQGLPCTCQAKLDNALRLIADKTVDIQSADVESIASQGPGKPVYRPRHKTNEAQNRRNADALNLSDGLGDVSAGDRSLDPLESLSRYIGESTGNINQEDTLEDAHLTQDDYDSFLFGGDRQVCHVCFNSGFVDGFVLNSGKRLVLDTTSMYELKRAEIDKKQRPYRVSLHGRKSYIEWKVELPKFSRLFSIGLFNNDIRIFDNAVTRVFIDDDWTNIHLGLINKLKPSNVIIRVYGNSDEVVEISHVELNFQLAPWPKLQMPSLSENTNMGFPGRILQTQFTLPPTLVRLAAKDIIFDAKHGHLWRINNVTEQQTSNNMIFGWQADARLVNTMETVYGMKPYWLPKKGKTYAGLERYQGFELYANPFEQTQIS